MHEVIQDVVIIAFCAVVAVFLSLRPVRRMRLWRATVTPLASIIGSGFLISGPLLAKIAGQYAFVLMILICAVGYAIGSAIRHNIMRLEPVIADAAAASGIRLAERISSLCLAVAYVISICFYIQLLAAFVLRAAAIDSPVLANVIATAILSFLGLVGLVRGFGHLERMEEFSVTLKLTVIAGLLAGLVGHDVEMFRLGTWHLSETADPFSFASLRMALGSLLIIQGFETSRYIGHVYEPEERVRSMRLAQLLASAIYVGFMLFIAGLLDPSLPAKETAIIDYSRQVALILPILLVFGGVAAQFSAATADFIGSAGLAVDSIPKVRERWLYPLIALAVIALTWATDVFEILTIASRAFAAYYLLQCLMALGFAGRSVGDWPPLWRMVVFSTGALASAATLLFGLPVH